MHRRPSRANSPRYPTRASSTAATIVAVEREDDLAGLGIPFISVAPFCQLPAMTVCLIFAGMSANIDLDPDIHWITDPMDDGHSQLPAAHSSLGVPPYWNVAEPNPTAASDTPDGAGVLAP